MAGRFHFELVLPRRTAKSAHQCCKTGILAPGKSFQVKSIVDIPVNGLLQPGDHVLQLDLGTWPHVTPAEQFKESWKKYGELVYEPVKSEPLPFHVPPEADFTKCRF